MTKETRRAVSTAIGSELPKEVPLPPSGSESPKIHAFYQTIAAGDTVIEPDYVPREPVCAGDNA